MLRGCPHEHKRTLRKGGIDQERGAGKCEAVVDVVEKQKR